MIQLVQGRRGVYFCSNWTAPGNGHDLSCVSGLVVAGAIGAPYPFTAQHQIEASNSSDPQQNEANGPMAKDMDKDKDAELDYRMGRAFMGF